MGSAGFLILIVFLGVIWVLLILPARRRRASHVAMQDSVDVGDEIITAGGIHADVTAVEGDLILAEIAAGVVVRLDRRAVAAVAREVEVEVAPLEDNGGSAPDGDETAPEDGSRAG